VRAAKAAPAARLNRMVFIFVPNGMHMADWKPAAEGANFALPYILEPLKNLRNDFSVLSGLAQNNARALGDGGGDHARSSATWLTGVHPRKTAGVDIKAGLSVDQLAARHVGQHTRFLRWKSASNAARRLAIAIQAIAVLIRRAFHGAANRRRWLRKLILALCSSAFFGNGENPEEAESRHHRQRYNKSILDFVSEDARALKKQLGAHDNRKLDEYLDGVREIEQRLSKTEEANSLQVDLRKQPSGIPKDVGEHIRLMSDMMVLAFQADLTRISTFMLANDGSNRSYRNIGISDGHHQISHHQGDKEKHEKIRLINRFHVEQLAYLLEKMKSIREGDSNMLDNSMIVYGAGHQRRRPSQPRRSADSACRSRWRQAQSRTASRLPRPDADEQSVSLHARPHERARRKIRRQHRAFRTPHLRLTAHNKAPRTS
jgi:hypothetical protein